jgi:hypothetical protein
MLCAFGESVFCSNLLIGAVCTEDEASFARFAAAVRALFLASHNSLPFASTDCNLFLPGRQERLWQLRAPALGNDLPQV